MKTKLVTTTELILKVLMLFSVLTVVQGISIFESINKVAIAVLSFFLVCHLFTLRYTRTQFIMLMITIIIHIIALAYTDFPLVNFNTLFYFLLWVCIYLFFAKCKDKVVNIMHNSDSYIKGVLWFWTVLVGMSALLPSSYDNHYFISFTGTSFRLMPATLIVTALAMYMAVHTKDKRYNLFLLLPTYTAFMNSSRTYFVIYLVFMLMYLYMHFRSKRKFYLMLLPLCVVVLLLMSVTGIADKLNSTIYNENSYFDFWGTITNGRTVFWKWDLEAFFDLPFLQQFVGNGFNFVYEVNGAQMTVIWAHNDFINLLMNFGYLGVIIYLWVYFKMVRAFWQKANQIPLFVKIMFHGAVFINSMANMSYTYLCAVIAYPLFLLVISEKYDGSVVMEKRAEQ